MLPHWNISCRSNVLPHPVTVYWHRADQSQRWPYNARRLAGSSLECQFWSHWYDSTWKTPVTSGIRTPDLPLLRQTPLTTRPTGRLSKRIMITMSMRRIRMRRIWMRTMKKLMMMKLMTIMMRSWWPWWRYRWCWLADGETGRSVCAAGQRGEGRPWLQTVGVPGRHPSCNQSRMSTNERTCAGITQLSLLFIGHSICLSQNVGVAVYGKAKGHTVNV